MDDDVFLRCIESNMLTDMTLQGIEQISKVNRTKTHHSYKTLQYNIVISHKLIIIMIVVVNSNKTCQTRVQRVKTRK